jgi:hypothetical protein
MDVLDLTTTHLLLAPVAIGGAAIAWRALPTAVTDRASAVLASATTFTRPGTPTCRAMADRIWRQFRPHVDDSLGADRVVAPRAMRIVASPADARFLLRNRTPIAEDLGLRCAERGWQLAPRIEVVTDQRASDGTLRVSALWDEENTDPGDAPTAATSAASPPTIPTLTDRASGVSKRIVGSLTIGRGDWNGWVLPAEDTTVSREGIVVEQIGATWQVRVPERCRTRVFVDGQRVEPGQARHLVDGDLTVGGHEFVFAAEGVGAGSGAGR